MASGRAITTRPFSARRRLSVSPATIKAHVERIIAKLGVSDRTQAAVLVARAEQG
ncbi:MAG: LuxR C-terminal-related transcriptional regulator [Novosphingobium sp.]